MQKPKKTPQIVISKIKSKSPVLLDIGCGPIKQFGHIGIDKIDYPTVDVLGDYKKVFNIIPDNSIDKIYSSHFIEHLEKPNQFVKEIFRTLKKSGTAKIIAPHFSNPYYYSDYTHKSFWGLYSFSYFTNKKYFRRVVPIYETNCSFKILSVNLKFGSSKPFYLRHITKKMFQTIFNCNIYMQELYEDVFSSIVSAYEIEYNLMKI